MALMAKVTIQMVDTDSHFLNTSIVEIDEIPMDNAIHGNLVGFLLETKNPQKEEEKKPAIVGSEEKK